MADEIKSTALINPKPSDYNIQGKKHYVFNQTGNILMSSTEEDAKDVPEEVRKTFNEVSVFFAAMTKSISQSLNPNFKDKEVYYSLYDYDAIEAIVNGSGYFVRVTEQDLKSESENVGANFSAELISGVLGFAVGNAIIPFAQSMVASMGKKGLELGSATSSSSSKVGNILFVCEYIMGMPLVTAIVLSIDASEAKAAYKAGPCFKYEKVKTTLNIHKDTYMFVTPTFISEYAQELNNEGNNVDYIELISHFKSLVGRNPFFTRFNTKEDGIISVGENASIIGEYFGTDEVTLESSIPEIEFAQSKVKSEPNLIKFGIKLKQGAKLDKNKDYSFAITIKGKRVSNKEEYTLTTSLLKLDPKSIPTT